MDPQEKLERGVWRMDLTLEARVLYPPPPISRSTFLILRIYLLLMTWARTKTACLPYRLGFEKMCPFLEREFASIGSPHTHISALAPAPILISLNFDD